MYRVLLAVDSDEQRAEQIAEAIAVLPTNTENLEVVILNVFEEFQVGDEGAPVKSEELYDETDFPDSVEVANKILDTAGVEVVKRREHGDPTESIIAVADEIGADCIAMTTRKRSPVGKVLLGSVTQSVLLSAERPVFVIPSD